PIGVIIYYRRYHRTVFFTRRNCFNSWAERKPSKADAMTRHRLGHPDPQALKHLVSSLRRYESRAFDACVTSKMKRQGHKRESGSFSLLRRSRSMIYSTRLRV